MQEQDQRCNQASESVEICQSNCIRDCHSYAKVTGVWVWGQMGAETDTTHSIESTINQDRATDYHCKSVISLRTALYVRQCDRRCLLINTIQSALVYGDEFWAPIPKGLVIAPEIAEIARMRTLFSARRWRETPPGYISGYFLMPLVISKGFVFFHIVVHTRRRLAPKIIHISIILQ